MKSASFLIPFADRLNQLEYFIYVKFPCLRGASCVKSWCLSLKRTPRLALDVEDLVLFLPPPEYFYTDDIARLIHALHMCVNLEELSVDLPFTLRRFVNGYFDQTESQFATFLKSHQLKTLEMHSEAFLGYRHDHGCLPNLTTLACSPLFHRGRRGRLPRLRLDFENSAYHDHSEMDMLNYISRCYSMSLALFLKRKPGGKQSHFLEVMNHFGKIDEEDFLRRLEIHQFLLPIVEERCLLFPSMDDFPEIRELILRPPPRLPRKSGDDPNLCAYVNL